MTGYWSPSAGVGSSWRLKLELPASKLPLPSSTSQLFFFLSSSGREVKAHLPSRLLILRFLYSSALRPPLSSLSLSLFPLFLDPLPPFCHPLLVLLLWGKREFFFPLPLGCTMREILHIQGGQCGNQIGAKFWEVSHPTTNNPTFAMIHWWWSCWLHSQKKRKKNWEKNRVVSWSFSISWIYDTALTEKKAWIKSFSQQLITKITCVSSLDAFPCHPTCLMPHFFPFFYFFSFSWEHSSK